MMIYFVFLFIHFCSLYFYFYFVSWIIAIQATNLFLLGIKSSYPAIPHGLHMVQWKHYKALKQVDLNDSSLQEEKCNQKNCQGKHLSYNNSSKVKPSLKQMARWAVQNICLAPSAFFLKISPQSSRNKPDTFF